VTIAVAVLGRVVLDVSLSRTAVDVTVAFARKMALPDAQWVNLHWPIIMRCRQPAEFQDTMHNVTEG
jgi:hypothetical protein